jgi:predicted permease
MESLFQDLRFAVRSLRKHPGFTAVAIATLALGIGANAAMFTVVNAVVLRPLPYLAADRLVRVTADVRGLGSEDIGVSPPELFDYRDRSELFDDIAGVFPIDANLTEVDEPERVEVLLVSPTYFSVLGVRPQLGRIFSADDNHPGIAEVVVISDALWKRRFGGRADVIGRKLRIDGDWFAVVGVAPPEFRHPGRALRTEVEMWAPSGYRATPFPPLEKSRGSYVLSGAIGRLKPGLSVSDAQMRLDAFAERLRAEYPTDYPSGAGWSPRIVGLQEDLVGRSKTALVMMLAFVGLVLLIACANIAGLVLARSAGRQRELGIRRALGAGRARLARLLLIESLLVAMCGGIVGFLVAVWGKDLVLALAPPTLPRMAEISIDVRVVLFAACVAFATGVLFGLAPAWQFSKPDVLRTLKDGSRGATARQSIRSVLVVGEFALAMVLLVASALLVRSFWLMMQVNPGFDGRRVLTAQLWLPQPNDPSQGRYFKHQARLAFFDEVLRRARELPGAEAAAIVQSLPLDGQRGFTTITIDGQAADASAQIPTVQGNIVSSDYFSLMGIPVRAGRAFDSTDVGGGPVAIINEQTARTYFAGSDPIGRRLHFGRPRPQPTWLTIVGVVGNVLTDNLEAEARPMVYRPLAQASSLSMGIVVRANTGPERLGVPLAQAVRRVDADQPTFAVRTMEQVVSDGMSSRRFAIQVVGAFAVLALLLAAIGIYGVMAYLVGQRTHEIGIRIALGARRAEVIWMVVARALALTAAGVVIGGVVSLAVSQLLAGMLFQIRPSDPWTFAAISALLTLTAVAAAAAPALRAAHVDPIVALRAE